MCQYVRAGTGDGTDGDGVLHVEIAGAAYLLNRRHRYAVRRGGIKWGTWSTSNECWITNRNRETRPDGNYHCARDKNLMGYEYNL